MRKPDYKPVSQKQAQNPAWTEMGPEKKDPDRVDGPATRDRIRENEKDGTRT
jgi:hypothetical protein